MQDRVNHRNTRPNKFIFTASFFGRVCALALVALTLVAGGCKRADREGSGSTGSSGAPASGSSHSGSDFEGVIDMKSDMGGRPASMTVYIKKGRLRTETKVADFPMGDLIQVWDYSTQKVSNIMPAQKSYTTMDFKSLGSAITQNGANGYKFPKLTKTGKTETVAGHSCEDYVAVYDEGQSMNMCMAKGFGSFGSGLIGMAPFSPDATQNAPPEWKELFESGAFPLKVNIVRNGQTQYSLEVDKIEPKAVEDSMFVIPAGYKEMKSLPTP